MEKTDKMKMEDRFETCPNCAYEGSFHVFLSRDRDTRPDEVRLNLKCPNCTHSYDLGLLCRIAREICDG